MSFLDLLFPKRCVACKKLGSYLCENCFAYLSFDAKSVCLVCRRGSADGLTHPGCCSKYKIDGAFSAIPYNKTAKKLIYTFKYKPYVSDLKNFLTDLFYEALIQNENFQREFRPKDDQPLAENNWVFVPIPLHSSKLRVRGYNQAKILADELGKRFNFEVLDLLKRIKNTGSQYGLKLKERRKNIKGAFSFKKEKKYQMYQKYQMKETGIFLVDDILTSGTTLSEAARILKRGGAKRVIGLTLARD